MGSAVGNKFFPALGIPANVETTLFNFVLSGVNNAFYNATGLRVVSSSGCLDFIVRVYKSLAQVDEKRSSLEEQDAKVQFDDFGTIAMVNGTALKGTVTHFDTTQNHDFKSTLIGNGFA